MGLDAAGRRIAGPRPGVGAMLGQRETRSVHLPVGFGNTTTEYALRTRTLLRTPSPLCRTRVAYQ